MKTYIIAEIGINHNGSIDLAKQLIDHAALAGCDAVKFQKRHPDYCVPEHQKTQRRSTPWGEMSYLDYKWRLEFDRAQYDDLWDHTNECGVDMFWSVWDEPSLKFVQKYPTRYTKIPSAMCTNLELIQSAKHSGDHIILSTGMSTLEEIEQAVALFEPGDELTLMHTRSEYPAQPQDLCMDTITWLSKFGYPVGYSSHDDGVWPAAATPYLGATMIEKHFTYDKTAWGTDHRASLDFSEMKKFVEAVRMIDSTRGERSYLTHGELLNRKKMGKL